MRYGPLPPGDTGELHGAQAPDKSALELELLGAVCVRCARVDAHTHAGAAAEAGCWGRGALGISLQLQAPAASLPLDTPPILGHARHFLFALQQSTGRTWLHCMCFIITIMVHARAHLTQPAGRLVCSGSMHGAHPCAIQHRLAPSHGAMPLAHP